MIVEKLFVLCLLPCLLAKAVPVTIKPHYNKPADQEIDGTVFINDIYKEADAPSAGFISEIYKELKPIFESITNVGQKPSLHYANSLPGGKLIYASTGPLNTDIADARTIYDAATKALEVANKAGLKYPLLVVGPMKSVPDQVKYPAFNEKYRTLNAILGALYASYIPLQDAELGTNLKRYKTLGVYGENQAMLTAVIDRAEKIEQGRWIARDLCGADPERMTPKKFEQYVNEIAWDAGITWVSTPIAKSGYPFIELFDRSNTLYPEYQGLIMKTTYTPTVPKETLYMIGQGVTFDTGGYDLRVSGAITGMSRQKCGAAGVVGFLKTMQLLNAQQKIVVKLVLLRNNIGAAAVTLDEIVKTKMDQRVRIGFTQAVGRMILSDLLFEAKGEALNPNAGNSHIYTVATMSSHVMRCYKYLMGIMDNGPASKAGIAEKLQKAGDRVADLGEISVIRKEDYDATNGRLETENMLASTNAISETMNRGHQIPMAFMVKASGMDKHGLSADADKQIKYTHLDVTGSAGRLGIVPTGSPIAMLTEMYYPLDQTVVPQM